MVRRMKVLGGMLPHRLVATAHMAARKAHAQMHPPSAGFQALFAAIRVGRNIVDLVGMRARCHKHLLLA